MALQQVVFTEWTSDQPSIVENLSIAKNVVPAAVGVGQTYRANLVNGASAISAFLFLLFK